jgi:FixJ family two-component response regulator
MTAIACKVIFVVEDDPSFLKGVTRLLRRHGFTVEAFNSAETFLEHALLCRAHCLLIDIHLDGKSGIELKLQLKASNCPPVIFMTGNDNERTRKEAATAGCVAYLCKPFSGNLLINAINSAVP